MPAKRPRSRKRKAEREPYTDDAFLLGVGRMIRLVRGMQWLPLEAVAHAASIHPRSLRAIELGRRNASILSLRRISTALGVPLSSLINDN